MRELAALLAARGIDAPVAVVGEGIARVELAGAEERWADLRDLPGLWPVLDGGGLDFPAEAEIARALALGRAFDAGSWLRRRRTVFEPDELPPPGDEPPPGLRPTDALLLVPTDVPWAAPAILGLRGGVADAEHHVAVHRRWHELYGAELCWASGAALEMWVERPPETELEAKVLAREQLAYCAGILAEPAIATAARSGAHPLEAIAAARRGARIWRFSWK